MAQGYSKSRKQERQPLPENNPLYKVWMLRESKTVAGVLERWIGYSFYNRNDPAKAYSYTKDIHKRIKTGYILFIDNISKELIEVWDVNYWRTPTEAELYNFNKQHIGHAYDKELDEDSGYRKPNFNESNYKRTNQGIQVE